MSSTESASYTKTAKTLHWLIAFGILLLLPMGWSFEFLPNGSTKFALFQLHKSIGITILLLSLARLGWRLTHTAPALPAAIPLWEQRAAHVGHALLYIGMIAMPLSGWIMVSTSKLNFPTILYGLVTWPAFPGVATSQNKEQINQLMGDAHGLGGWVLAILVAGHVAAALWHHYKARNDILLRMMPRFLEGHLNRARGVK
jgi:cytochrome b561